MGPRHRQGKGRPRQFAEHLGSARRAYAQARGGGALGILRGNSRRINHQIRPDDEIGVVPHPYGKALFAQLRQHPGIDAIRSTYGHALGGEDAGQTLHSGPTDADQVGTANFVQCTLHHRALTNCPALAECVSAVVVRATPSKMPPPAIFPNSDEPP